LKRLTQKQSAFVRRRSAIEAIISHLKQGCRMGRNFLKGTIGDQMNAIFAAAAFNFRKLLTAVIYLALKIFALFQQLCGARGLPDPQVAL
jgi:IS5 family transposase